MNCKELIDFYKTELEKKKEQYEKGIISQDELIRFTQFIQKKIENIIYGEDCQAEWWYYSYQALKKTIQDILNIPKKMTQYATEIIKYPLKELFPFFILAILFLILFFLVFKRK